MPAIEDITSLATLVILLQLVLQGWVMAVTVRRPRSTRSIALFVAAGALAIRGVAILSGAEIPDILEETAILVVSGALLAAQSSARKSAFGISDIDHTLMEKSPNPIMIKRASGEYVYVNPSFEVSFECKSRELLGRKAEDIWTQDLSEAALEGDRRTLKTGQPAFHEVTFTTADGQTHYWLISKFLLPVSGGEPLIVTVYTNVSKQMEIENLLALSEQRYALASQHAGIWDWTPRTGALYLSPAFCALMQINPDNESAISIKDVVALIHPDDFPLHQKRLKAHFAKPEVPYISDHRYRMQDGSYRWFRAVGRSVVDDQGKILRMTGMITDIDHERKATEALRMSEARISTLLDNSPAPIYFKDKHLRFVMVNRQCAENYQVPQADFIGKTSLEIFGPDWGTSFMAHDRAVLENRATMTQEVTVNDLIFLTTKFPIIDGEGELIGVGGIETDITERVNVEKAYRKARDDAEMANRSKSTFLANMSHELRTPLNSIIGFSDSLLAGTLGEIANPMHREYLAIIRTGGEHLLQLINDILDLSRIEAGKLVLEETPVDLHAVFNEAIRLTAEQAGSGGLFVESTIPEGLPRLFADERQLKQVLINLLSNAIKFTNPGGRIMVEALRMNDGGLEIRVEDTGVGIDAESLKLVQQPFVQVADAMTRKHQGSGLGLAIVRSIVTMHDGTFNLESAPGVGTTAIITLPKSRLMDQPG
ncbi:MAG: PAS domain-containing protein [Rhodospirillales bacterium]